MEQSPPDSTETAGKRYRRLRAVLAADVENFGGHVSVNETITLDALLVTRRIAREELAIHGGWLFGMPGDGIFALFESAVSAVQCAMETQARLAAIPQLDMIKLRVGIHLGEVLFQDDLPFGEPLVIAARLESLAEPGGILVSAAVMEAVAPRISVFFLERGVFSLKHSPRRVTTYSVLPPATADDPSISFIKEETLDQTVLTVRPKRLEPGTQPAAPAAPRGEPPALSLPKAAQLVVPNSRPEHETARSGIQDSAAIDEITQILMMHLGPVAPLLVKRFAAKLSDPIDLIRTLAEEIPAGAERTRFVAHARQAIVQLRR
jgi:class 3 adenylate cyclase